MSTTPVETWQNVDGEALGPLYPFVGIEGWLVAAGVVLWLIWHIWQMRDESRIYRDDLETLRKNNNLDKAIKGENVLK